MGRGEDGRPSPDFELATGQRSFIYDWGFYTNDELGTIPNVNDIRMIPQNKEIPKA